MSQLETKSGGLCVCAHLGLDCPFFTFSLAFTLISAFHLSGSTIVWIGAVLVPVSSEGLEGIGRGRLTLLLIQLDGNFLLARSSPPFLPPRAIAAPPLCSRHANDRTDLITLLIFFLP